MGVLQRLTMVCATAELAMGVGSPYSMHHLGLKKDAWPPSVWVEATKTPVGSKHQGVEAAIAEMLRF